MKKATPEKRVLLSERREDAERELIANVIAYKPTRAEMDELLSICPKGACKHRDYAPFWDAAADIHAAGQEVNGVTMFDELKSTYKGNDLANILAGYMHGASYAGAVEWWANRVAEIGRLEELQFVLEEYAVKVSDAFAESDVIAAEIQNSLQKYGTADEAMPTLDTLLTGIVANVERGIAAKPLPSPWPTLNNVLKGGIATGELAVLAARPGMGKTALAGCWALEIARAFGPVLFISCEVKDSTIGSRLLAREGKIDNRAFREGLGMSQLQISQIRDAAEALRNIPLHIVDTSRQAITPMQVRRLARKIPGGPRMVVVDYLQLMYPDTKHDSREREIADMSRSMKRLAVELNCPVLLLSQLNRKVEEGNREPQLSDLRESGAVEQDADIVIMLHADKKELNSADVLMQALVRKGRSSGTGAAGLIFHKAYSDFSEGTYVKREKQAKEFDL
jgi:replicative DNA helicase